MTSKAQIFISQVEAPFLSVLDKTAKQKVYDLLIAYSDYKQKIVPQAGEQNVMLWNCCSVEVMEIMTAYYLARMQVYHAAKISRHEAALEGPDREADSEDDSDEDSELVTHDRRIVETAEDEPDQEYARSATPARDRPISLSSSLDQPSGRSAKKMRERERVARRAAMEAYRAELKAEWLKEIRQDDVLEDEFTHRFGPVTLTEALAHLARAYAPYGQ